MIAVDVAAPTSVKFAWPQVGVNSIVTLPVLDPVNSVLIDPTVG